MEEVDPVTSSPPASSSYKSNTKDFKTLISFYSNYVWNRLFGSSPSPDSNFLAKISTLFQKTPTLALRPRSRKRTPCLPLPLPSNSLQFSSDMSEPFKSRVREVLEEIMAHVFTNLHIIQKNLRFWQSQAEESNARKIYFMMFERGPWAFLDGMYKLIHESVMDGFSSMQHLFNSASAYISERIVILTNLRFSLATFLAEVYIEVDRLGEELIKNPVRSLPVLLTCINGLFLKLEESISCLRSLKQNSSVEEICSSPLVFERLPEVNQEGSQWTDCEIGDAINLIYQNLHKLDSYLSSNISKYKKPRRLTLYWVRYTCGAIGIAASSAWLVRHSSLMGSSDIDNWICEARDSTISFYNDHVEQPLLSIRDELFNTFRKRHKGVMEIEEVQLTANSLHRMLLAFSEQAKGQKFPENASDQEMLGIVMARYEKELMHPIQNLLGGELARAMLIQVQKLKLDVETAMLELDQILRANEINFAVLAALPAFFLSYILLMLMRAWLKQDARAEGRGRIARVQRRLLLGEIEKWLMEYQVSVDQGLENDAQCMYGLILYSLDRLYHAVERHAKGTGEWHWLRQDIIDLAKPGLQTAYKFKVTSRMERIYDCLLPSPKRQ